MVNCSSTKNEWRWKMHMMYGYNGWEWQYTCGGVKKPIGSGMHKFREVLEDKFRQMEMMAKKQIQWSRWRSKWVSNLCESCAFKILRSNVNSTEVFQPNLLFTTACKYLGPKLQNSHLQTKTSAHQMWSMTEIMYILQWREHVIEQKRWNLFYKWEEWGVILNVRWKQCSIIQETFVNIMNPDEDEQRTKCVVQSSWGWNHQFHSVSAEQINSFKSGHHSTRGICWIG